MEKKKTIAQVAKEMALAESIEGKPPILVMGNLDLMGRIFNKCKELGIVREPKIPHPLNRIDAVLNGLESNTRTRNPIFKKCYIKYTNGRAEVLHRAYELIEAETVRLPPPDKSGGFRRVS